MPGMVESHSSGALPRAAGAGATLGVATELWPWAEQGWVARMGTWALRGWGNKFGILLGDSLWSLELPSRTGGHPATNTFSGLRNPKSGAWEW